VHRVDHQPERRIDNQTRFFRVDVSTCPPLAVDRLIGLAGVSKNLVGCMEEGTLPPRMNPALLEKDLTKIGTIIERMADPDIFVWLGRSADATYLHALLAGCVDVVG